MARLGTGRAELELTTPDGASLHAELFMPDGPGPSEEGKRTASEGQAGSRRISP